MRTIQHLGEEKSPVTLWCERARPWGSWEYWCLWVLLWGLVAHNGWSQTIPDVVNPVSSSPARQNTAALPRGMAAAAANLRASPSMQGEVLAVVHAGAALQILAESGRWYRIRTDDGLEAWIGKALVHLDDSPSYPPMRGLTRGTPSEVSLPMDVMPVVPEPLELSPMTREPPPTSLMDTPAKEEEYISLGLESVPLSALEDTGLRHTVKTLLGRFEGLEGYVIPILVAMLTLAIILQLRAARQLRRALGDMGEILDIVEEITVTGGMQGPGVGRALPTAEGREVPALRAQNLAVQFSAIERAILQALSKEPEVQETDLVNTLAQQGFAGILIKAVMAEILTKTTAMGQAMIGVRYHEGQYRYTLRSGGVSAIAQRSRD